MSSTSPAGGTGAPTPGPARVPAGHVLIDGLPVPYAPGDTVMAAAQRAGHAIPHLCWHPQLGQSGACRVCTVRIDGRLVAACTTPAADGQVVENRSDDLEARRRTLLQMLFVEGNHFCPSCERSGDCLLQATASAMRMTGPGFEEFHPRRPLDASHPAVWLDLDRCILCKLCVRASREVDGKDVFAIAGYGIGTRLVVDSPTGRLGDSALAADDLAARICPVGAILPRGRGFATPIGARRFDLAPVRVGPAEPGGPTDD
jgi:[NiFe] hydrogenase diaphorase moiety small subunit